MVSSQPTSRGGGLDDGVVVAAADAGGDAKPDTADAAAAGGGGGYGEGGPSDGSMGSVESMADLSLNDLEGYGTNSTVSTRLPMAPTDVGGWEHSFMLTERKETGIMKAVG